MTSTAEGIRTYRLSRGARLGLRLGFPIVCLAIVAQVTSEAGVVAAAVMFCLAAPVAFGFVRWARNRIDLFPDKVVVVRAFRTYTLPGSTIADVECAAPFLWRIICFRLTSGDRVLSHAVAGRQTFYPDEAFDQKLSEIQKAVQLMRQATKQSDPTPGRHIVT